MKNKPLIIAAQEYAEKINKHIPGYTVERALKIFENNVDYIYKWLKFYTNYQAYIENTKKLFAIKTISVDYLVQNSIKINTYYNEYMKWNEKFASINIYDEPSKLEEMIKESDRLSAMYNKAFEDLKAETTAIYKKYSVFPGSETTISLILDNFVRIGANYKLMAEAQKLLVNEARKSVATVKTIEASLRRNKNEN